MSDLILYQRKFRTVIFNLNRFALPFFLFNHSRLLQTIRNWLIDKSQPFPYIIVTKVKSSRLNSKHTIITVSKNLKIALRRPQGSANSHQVLSKQTPCYNQLHVIQKCLKVVQKLSKNCPKVVSTVLNKILSDPKVVLELCQRSLKFVLKLFLGCFK